MATMKFPSQEEFLVLFELFPKGNPEKVYTSIKYIISSKKTFPGDPVTWDLIKTSFTKYIEKRRKEDVQDKFIKSLESFCDAGDYNINFDHEPSQQKKNTFETGMDSAMDELEKRLRDQ